MRIHYQFAAAPRISLVRWGIWVEFGCVSLRSMDLDQRKECQGVSGELTRSGHTCDNVVTTSAASARFRRTSLVGKHGAMPSKYDESAKASAVRLVREHRDDYDSEWAAMKAIAGRLGMTGEAAGVSTDESRAAGAA